MASCPGWPHPGDPAKQEPFELMASQEYAPWSVASAEGHLISPNAWFPPYYNARLPQLMHNHAFELFCYHLRRANLLALVRNMSPVQSPYYFWGWNSHGGAVDGEREAVVNVHLGGRGDDDDWRCLNCKSELIPSILSDVMMTLTAADLVTLVLAIHFSVAVEGLWDALVPN